MNNTALRKGNTYYITVKPNSSKNEIIYEENNIIVRLTAKPQDNEANIQLVKFMKKLGLSIEIVKGSRSRKKVIYIKA